MMGLFFAILLPSVDQQMQKRVFTIPIFLRQFVLIALPHCTLHEHHQDQLCSEILVVTLDELQAVLKSTIAKVTTKTSVPAQINFPHFDPWNEYKLLFTSMPLSAP